MHGTMVHFTFVFPTKYDNYSDKYFCNNQPTTFSLIEKLNEAHKTKGS